MEVDPMFKDSKYQIFVSNPNVEVIAHVTEKLEHPAD